MKKWPYIGVVCALVAAGLAIRGRLCSRHEPGAHSVQRPSADVSEPAIREARLPQPGSAESTGRLQTPARPAGDNPEYGMDGKPSLDHPSAALAHSLRLREMRTRDAARRRAADEGWDKELGDNKRHSHLLAIVDGRVYERMTYNKNAAMSTAADLVSQTEPYNFDGAGAIVGVWDEGAVRGTHQELVDRVTLKDQGTAQTHGTHVAGTIAASGVREAAKGMAPAALIHSYNWDYDYSEMGSSGMTAEGQPGKLQISNHSYGFKAGWVGSSWYGTWGERESDAFGMYDEYARVMDSVCFGTPYLLPFKAAGNDRNDSAPSSGNEFSYYDNGWQTKIYDPDTDPYADGWDQGGFDTIAYDATAKNVMTVGAVNDAMLDNARSLEMATMTGYSSWGPTDDGRVKPDIVANGHNLLSCSASYDSSYITMYGTSMAAPNAAGSAALLVDGYGRLFPGRNMRSSTLKGLILHTADDLGRPGPDYRFGWGLMNTKAAADHLMSHHSRTNACRLVEDSLSPAARTNIHAFTWSGTEPIRATICWTDPPGQEHEGLDDRTTVLRHNLDLRVVSPGGVTHFPFVLDVENPDQPATTGDNNVDNVEQVLVTNPVQEGVYHIIVSAEGEFFMDEQVYSLLVSGSIVPPEIKHTALANTTNTVGPYVVEAHIESEQTLDPASLQLIWSVTGVTTAAGTGTLVHVSNDVYRAEIPGQPRGSEIAYYMVAETTGGHRSVYPANAPGEEIRFRVVESVLLVISGLPVNVPSVDPDYGIYRYPQGITITARASAFSQPEEGVRSMCVGWMGYGSAPLEGVTNEVTFQVDSDTFLGWLWDTAYELSQISLPPGGVSTSTWWRTGTRAATVEAPQELDLDGTNYLFVGWYSEGERLPGPGDPVQNPAEGIRMYGPSVATAKYLRADLDDDGDEMPDWWEIFYFGSVNAQGNIDADGDGFSNLKEFQDKSDPRDPGSMPLPPSIAHVPLAQPQTHPAAWPVAATVTDNNSVSEVLLEWSRNGDAWQSLAMTPSSSTNTYTSSIPAPGISGDTFSYRIVARDVAGLMSINGTYTFEVTYAICSVTPDELGIVQLPQGGSAELGLVVSNTGQTALDWELEIVEGGLWDSVEAGTNGWTHGGRRDVWHVSSLRAYSGKHSWYFGRDDRGNYPDSADAWLVSPPVYLGPDAVFSFQQWLNTEELKDPEHAWDGCMVEISTNSGVSYFQIEPKNGYPYVMHGHAQSAYPDGTPVFAGTGGWERVEFPLREYAGRFVRLRLRFGSDGYVVNEGWFVDDLEITPWGESPSWLEISQTSGVVDYGGNDPLALSLSAARIGMSGTRVLVLRFHSNDPVRPCIDVPLGLHNTSRLLVATVNGSGSIFPEGGLVMELGDTTNFVIRAEPYHHIESIMTNSGAVALSPGLVYTNFFWADISFNGVGRIHAEISPDRTASGVPLPWLMAHGLTNVSFDLEAEADQDGDNMLTWQEYIAGTDPTNRASCFRVTRVDSSGPLRIMQWLSTSERLYHLYAATNLEAEFAVVTTNLPATPPVNTFVDDRGEGSVKFYRVGVTLEK